MIVKKKGLNLYACIGGNRKLWPDDEIEVTAVELCEKTAAIYQDYFPNDKIIIGDAHQYLLEHYKEFDFIWSSPPCPTHSQFAKLRAHSDDQGTGNAATEAKYTDMKLYQEIIFLQHFAGPNQKYCVENVQPYYEPLISPQKSGRHLFWSNFYINNIRVETESNIKQMTGNETVFGFNLDKYSGIDKRKTLRNMVNPKLGLHIYNCAFKDVQLELF